MHNLNDKLINENNIAWIHLETSWMEGTPVERVHGVVIHFVGGGKLYLQGDDADAARRHFRYGVMPGRQHNGSARANANGQRHLPA